jgi:hypothetical protein
MTHQISVYFSEVSNCWTPFNVGTEQNFSTEKSESIRENFEHFS